jgi:hypothetical protein
MPLLAVSMVVALPDICASLMSDDGKTNSARYKDWCKANLGAEFKEVTPDDLYSMRCGVLHNGRFGELKHSVARVIFVPPSKDRNTFVDGHIMDAYFYSVVPFCAAFTAAVYRWVEANRGNVNIEANIGHLMQYRNGGFPPYVVGLTVLA